MLSELGLRHRRWCAADDLDSLVSWAAASAAADEMQLADRALRWILRTERYPCPCCGHLVFSEPPGSYDICPICFWDDGPVQLRWPVHVGGGNRLSLVEAQIEYAITGAASRWIAMASIMQADRVVDDRVHVFEHADGDWWAECLICRAWVTTANLSRRGAEEVFGRHLQHDHQAGHDEDGNEIGQAPARGRETVPADEAEQLLAGLANSEVVLGAAVEVTQCPRCGSDDVMWGCDPAQDRGRDEVHPLVWHGTELMADAFICRSCWAGWIEPYEVAPITWVRPYWRV